MDCGKVFAKAMKVNGNYRTIMKFDTGASGFKTAAYVLAFTAGCVLLLGLYFIFFVLRPFGP